MAALNEEQSMIKDQASAWVIKENPVKKFRAMRDSNNALGFDQATWQHIVDMGWAGILVPEQYGGSDLGYLTFGIILEQLGQQLVASPLFASAYVGASALLLAGNEQQKHHLLPAIAEGKEIVTLALEEGSHHAPEKIALSAKKEGSHFVLNGEKTFVLEGMAATTFIVVARTAGKAGDKKGISLFLVKADAQGVSRERLYTTDSRGYAKVNFNNVRVSENDVLGKTNEAYDVLENILDRARAGMTMDMLGTASQAFEMTLDYLKTRVQFGAVIGSFQALGHRAAALFGQKELARSCAEAALQSIDAGANNLDEMASLAKCKVGDFIHLMSNELIQMHGGIGMTDEFDAGLYLKRARVLEACYGNQGYHRNRFAEIKGF